MDDSVFMAELSWPEFEGEDRRRARRCSCRSARPSSTARICRSASMSYLPTGVCERVAREVGGIVAPTIPYGYKSQPRSGGGEAFPGTRASTRTPSRWSLRDVIRGLGHHGVRRLVVLNGHFENAWPSVEGVDLGLRELRRDGIADMQLMRLEYWDFVRRDTLDKLFPDGFPGTELEHASLLETSLMLLMRPDLVDMAKGALRRAGEIPDLRPHAGAARASVPGLRRARRARRPSTAEKGDWLMADHVELIVRAVRREFGL